MYPQTEYLISEEQIRRITAANAPVAVTQLLTGLPRIRKAWQEGDLVRRDTLSAWKVLTLFSQKVAERWLPERKTKAFGVLLWNLTAVWDLLILFGAIAGIQWGVNYGKSHLDGVPTPMVFGTILSVVILGCSIAVSLTTALIELPKKLRSTENDLAGFVINEVQIRQLLKAAPAPGFVIEILDSLPVIDNSPNSSAIYSDALTVCHIDPMAEPVPSTSPGRNACLKPTSQRRKLLKSLLIVAPLWLGVGYLNSGPGGIIDTVSVIVLILTVLNEVVRTRLVHKNEELIKVRQGLTTW